MIWRLPVGSFSVGDLVMHSDDSECGIVLDTSWATNDPHGATYRNSVKVLFADQDIDWIQTKYLTNVCKNTSDMV